MELKLVQNILQNISRLDAARTQFEWERQQKAKKEIMLYKPPLPRNSQFFV